MYEREITSRCCVKETKIGSGYCARHITIMPARRKARLCFLLSTVIQLNPLTAMARDALRERGVKGIVTEYTVQATRIESKLVPPRNNHSEVFRQHNRHMEETEVVIPLSFDGGLDEVFGNSPLTLEITPSSTIGPTPSVAPTKSLLKSSRPPSSDPSAGPSISPATRQPTVAPTTMNPTGRPTSHPSASPTTLPTTVKSNPPTFAPSTRPPTVQPSVGITPVPSTGPSMTATLESSQDPTLFPSVNPTVTSSVEPSTSPSSNPSLTPSHLESVSPTMTFSAVPSVTASVLPSSNPSSEPSLSSTASPSTTTSLSPTPNPTAELSSSPSSTPSASISVAPSVTPSAEHSSSPSRANTQGPSSEPSFTPSNLQSEIPSSDLSRGPSEIPSMQPSISPSATISSTPSVQPTGLPSTMPSYFPSGSPSIEPTPLCYDDENYRHPKKSYWGCSHHFEQFDCEEFGRGSGLSENEIEELKRNCSLSCGLCDPAPSSSPTKFSHQLVPLAAELEYFISSVPEKMNSTIEEEFEQLSLSFFNSLFDPSSMESTANVTAVALRNQEVQSSARRSLRSEDYLSFSSSVTLKVSVIVNGTSRDDISNEAFEEILLESIDDPRYTATLRIHPFFVEATVMRELDNATQPDEGISSSVKSVAIIVLSTFGVAATIALSTGGFLFLRRQKKDNGTMFIPSVQTNRDVQLISEDREASKDEESNQSQNQQYTFPDEEALPSTSTCKEGFTFNQVDDMGSYSKRSSSCSPDSTFHLSDDNEQSQCWPPNLLEGIPPMIVIGNIEQNLREVDSAGHFPTALPESTTPESRTSPEREAPYDEEDFKGLLVRHIEASSSFVEALSARRPMQAVSSVEDQRLRFMNSQDKDDDFANLVSSPISLHSKLRSGRGTRSTLYNDDSEGDDSVASTPAISQNAADDIDVNVAHRRTFSAGALQKIQPSEALDNLIRSEWSSLGLTPTNIALQYANRVNDSPLKAGSRKHALSSRVNKENSSGGRGGDDIVVELERLEREFEKSRDMEEMVPMRARSLSEPECREAAIRERSLSDPENQRAREEGVEEEDEHIGTVMYTIDTVLANGSNVSNCESRSGSRPGSRSASPTMASADASSFFQGGPPLLPPHHTRNNSRGSQKTASPTAPGEASTFFQGGPPLLPPHHSRNNSRGSLGGSRAASPTAASGDVNTFGQGGPPHHSRNNSRSSVGTKRSWCEEMHASHSGNFRYTFDAPSRGKLGVIIESSKDLGPTICTVKDYSPLFGMVKPGDKIVSVGDQNTEHMSTSEITSLLARKRAEKEDGMIKITVVSATEKIGFTCDDFSNNVREVRGDSDILSSEYEKDSGPSGSASEDDGKTSSSPECGKSSDESEESAFHLIGGLCDEDFEDDDLFL